MNNNNNNNSTITTNNNNSSQLKSPKKKENSLETLESSLEKEYNDYLENLKEIYPGSKLTNDIYCKLISLIQHENDYVKSPSEQKEKISKILNDFFTKNDDIPKIMQLYPDILQYNQMKDLEYRNSPEQVKNILINFYINKYFRLNNIREKILTKSNQILNFKDFNDKFTQNKDYKLSKINTEIDLTLKRIFRLKNVEEKRKKDYEYYLKHFKVKRIDNIFLKKTQENTFYNLRKDDFEVYFREILYKNKVNLIINSFKSCITFAPISKGNKIWKNSKFFLNNYFKKNFEKKMKDIKNIYKSEKSHCPANDIKLFKEYFKSKYQFYYKMKNEFEDEKTCYNFSYDIYYPPMIISLNSEIRPYLKELCEYFNINFDLSIDKGKSFSYNINVFYPTYFGIQSKNFQFNPYELTFNEIISGEMTNKNKNEINIEAKPTEILRNKYNVKDGFLVNGENNNKFLNENLKHTSFKSQVYIKTSYWINCICVYPDFDIKYHQQIKQLNEIGYVDSSFKYILEIIEKIDLSTLNRLIDDYTMNTSTRIRNTIKLISSKKEENEYSQLRDLVAEIIENDDIEKGTKNKTENLKNILNPHDEYTEKVDSDLLKYLMTLRFLKLRDYKWYILNLLNYFRYIQKRIVIDNYKIENKNWKKSEDLKNLTETLSMTLPYNYFKPKKLITHQPLSEFSKTNPIMPSLEKILETKPNEDSYNKLYFEEIDESVEYLDKLIRIKDNKGNYIIYEATLSDMKQLEDEFCKIATFYIQKKEKLIVDTDKVPNPFIDRTQVILDLFLNEFDFLYAKFEFISELMTIYENTTDIFKQKSLMKNITNVMAQRPHLELEYHYFKSSYEIEVEVLRKKAAFMHILIDFQKKIEMNENRILYDSIDKYYWLLGETALEIIQHVRIDKSDVETLKQMMDVKLSKENKENNNVYEFIDLFTRLNKEKSLENSKILKFNENESELNSNNESKISDKNEEKIEKKISLFIKYLKKLFNIALTGGEDNFLENQTEELIKSQDEIISNLKESLSLSISETDENEKKKKLQKGNNYSFSISNESLDLLNYQVRSLLNIPNPFLKDSYLNYIEKNPQIISSVNKEINFIRFEEGFPHKYLENDDSKIIEMEFFESLIDIIDIFQLIKQTKNFFFEKYIFENFIAKNGLEISFLDYLIEEWENFKDCISGKKSTSEFDKLYYLQNTIVDNYHSLFYSIKNLTAILGNTINKIPPEILAYLPNNVIEKNFLETIKYENIKSPKNPNEIENLLYIDLEKSLLKIVENDFKNGWLDFKNSYDELNIYLNAMEMVRMKKIIFNLIEKNTLLSMIYENQKTNFLNKNDDILNIKENVGILPYEDPDNNINYLDRFYFMNKKEEIPHFSIEEFDPSLTTCVYFKDLISVQQNLFERGIDELKTFASYEYMNLILLLTATQYNNILFFESEKYMQEINLFKDKIVCNNNLFDWKSIVYSRDINKNVQAILHDKEKKINEINLRLAKDNFYIIVEKKLKNRSNTLLKYNTFIESKIKFLKKSSLIKHIFARTERLLLINAYIKDISLEVYLDCIKLQSCLFSEKLRKIIKTIPKEYNTFDINDFHFIDNEKRLFESTTPHKNFWYFVDKGKIFNKFYIPSNLEILKLKNQNDEDIVYHYSKFNPFNFSEDVLNQKYFTQMKDLYYNSPEICNKIEDGRNKFFIQAMNYQSNAFLFLRICNFYLNFINLKFIDVYLTQKPMEIMQVIDLVDKGDDFWGDKKTSVSNFEEKNRIPLNIVEKIIESQKNYLNLRINFDRFKIDIEEQTKIIIKYLETPNKLLNYIEKFMNYKLFHWYHIFNIEREFCIKKNDLNSFDFLSKIIKENFLFGKCDYFKDNNCKFEIHLNENEFNYDYKKTTFLNHMNFSLENVIFLEKFKQMHYYDFTYKNLPLIQGNFLTFNENIKYYFPFIFDNKIAEIRNLNFKINSMTKNYLIYIEKSSLNSDYILLDEEKIKFLLNYIKLTEFKNKFLILIEGDFLPNKSKEFLRLESIVKRDFNSINCDLIENLNISDSNLLENEKKTKEENKNLEENINVFDNQRENDLKMKNSIIIEQFLNQTNSLFNSFQNEVRFILLNKSLNFLEKQNNAFKELITGSRNDLDIIKFRNKFSSNFLKELDIVQINNINKKFPFFENFINKIKNISLEVETHSDSNALLISRNEYETAVKNLMHDFIAFDSNSMRSAQFSNSSEKFGYYFSIKKLEIWLTAYKNKLIQFDNDLEKISNAKIAITNNTLVYEMDNLYRQLKVLKDNIKIMEIYIRDYFEDKFNGLILSFKTELSQIESRFQEFRNDLVIKTNISITEEYNKCIQKLKDKSIFITNTVNKISDVDTTQEKEFFDTFFRGLNMNTNYHKELNNERNIIKNLQDDIMKLHGYYRMKLHTQKVEFENELDTLRKNLSNNKDLWDKLAIAERNEAILKEELAKTQKSLAAAEEFIKRLRIQIRNSHDKNVMLEKKLSESSVKETINQGGKGTNLKAMELYSDIRQNYVYNMKNNVNIITALDNIKTKYADDEDIKTILNNFEMLHKKYSEEVDNKRNFVTTLSHIKEDVERMQMLHNKKIEEFGRENSMLKEENTNLKIEIEKMKIKNNSQLATSRKLNKSINIDLSKLNSSQGKDKNNNNNNTSNVSKKSEKFPIIIQSKKNGEEKKMNNNNKEHK